MPAPRKVRDNDLVDAVEASTRAAFKGSVWRVVRSDRDPLRTSSPRGRWDDGTFDVLYTSAEAEGALAEMHFHLMRGLPVFPSQMRFLLYELEVVLHRALRLPDTAALASLGVDTAKYGSTDYLQRQTEYARTQQIAEAAHLLDFDGLVVPNARWACQNVILFSDRVPPENLHVAGDGVIVDWTELTRRSKSH